MILLYHKIYPESPTKWWVTVNSFWRQMEQLRRYQIVALDEYDPADPRQVVITFDGVYDNVYTFALPILQRFGYPFELFIIGETIGKENDFDRKTEPLARFANEDQLKKMAQGNGHLQWHSLSHQDLTQISAAKAVKQELTVPQNIRKLDPSGFDWFAYPHGRHIESTIELVKQTFKGGLSCEAGNDQDRFQLNRKIITNDTCFSQTRVSLIIANYNYGHLAAEAIESALNQTVPPDDMLFIDDASVDNSIEVAERYRDRIQIVRNEQNLGIVANFNKAVSLTTGDYICFLGADNCLRSDYVEKCKLALDTHPEAAIAYTNVVLFGPRAEVLAKKVQARPLSGFNDFYLWEFPAFNQQTSKLLQQQNFIHGSSMYRRVAFQEAGGYQNSELPEDHNLFYRMVKKGWQAVLCPDFLLEYRQHSSYQANTQLNYAQELAYARRQLKIKNNEVQNLRQAVNRNHTTGSLLPRLLHDIGTITKTGNITGALQAAQNAFQNFPELGKLAYQYALLLAYQKNFQLAQVQLEQALLYDPKLVEAHNDLGVLLFRQGNSEVASDHFLRAVQLDPNYDVAWKNLAQLYLESGRVKDAVDIYQRILTAKPNDVETLLAVANLFVQAGNNENAKDFYYRILAIQPNHPDAKAGLEMLTHGNDQSKKTYPQPQLEDASQLCQNR